MKITRRMLVGVTCAAALSACVGSVDQPASRMLGYLLVNTGPLSGNVGVIRPTGQFVRTSGYDLVDSSEPVDTCYVRPYDPNQQSSGAGLNFIAAGDSVGVQTTEGTGTLLPVATQGEIVYRLGQGATGIPHEPGTEVTFEVPGAAGGFPEATLTATTAPAFTLGPVPTDPDGDLTITWTPAGSSQTKMLLGLQYATLGSSVLNEQLFCATGDDGSVTIGSQLLGGWRAAAQAGREQSVQASRFRTALRDVGDAGQAQLYLYSSYDIERTELP